MKGLLAAITSVSVCLLSQNAIAGNAQSTQLKDKKDKISYSIGVDVGKSIQKQKFDINPDMFITGFKEGLANKLTLMPEDEIKQTLIALQTEMQEKQKNEIKEAATKNLADGQKFLDDNKKRKDVVTLPSGLQYRVIKDGKGDAPKATDTVTTHYKGRLINGTEFDSSYTRGEPVKFAVNGVIPGWSEALVMMKPGAKWELFIPPKLAYGENGVGAIIGPNSTLIFEVELLNVDKAAKAATTNSSSATTTNTSTK